MYSRLNMLIATTYCCIALHEQNSSLNISLAFRSLPATWTWFLWRLHVYIVSVICSWAQRRGTRNV